MYDDSFEQDSFDSDFGADDTFDLVDALLNIQPDEEEETGEDEFIDFPNRHIDDDIYRDR